LLLLLFDVVLEEQAAKNNESTNVKAISNNDFCFTFNSPLKFLNVLKMKGKEC